MTMDIHLEGEVEKENEVEEKEEIAVAISLLFPSPSLSIFFFFFFFFIILPLSLKFLVDPKTDNKNQWNFPQKYFPPFLMATIISFPNPFYFNDTSPSLNQTKINK